MTIEPSIGVVRETSGYRLVRPIQTTKYTLTAIGPAGTVSKDITVSVTDSGRANCAQ